MHETPAAWIKTQDGDGRRRLCLLQFGAVSAAHAPARPRPRAGDARERKPAGGADTQVPIRKAGRRLAALARAQPPVCSSPPSEPSPRLPGAPLAKALGPTSCSVTSAPQFAVRKRKSICHSALAFFLVGNGQAAYTLTSLTKTFFFFLQ